MLTGACAAWVGSWSGRTGEDTRVSSTRVQDTRTRKPATAVRQAIVLIADTSGRLTCQRRGSLASSRVRSISLRKSRARGRRWGSVFVRPVLGSVAEKGSPPFRKGYWGHRKVSSYDYAKEASSLGTTLWGSAPLSISLAERGPIRETRPRSAGASSRGRGRCAPPTRWRARRASRPSAGRVPKRSRAAPNQQPYEIDRQRVGDSGGGRQGDLP